MKEELNNIRVQLDKIDRKIIESLAERQEIVHKVFELKAKNSGNIRDYQREEEILAKLGQMAREYGLDRYFVEQIFREIINQSVRFQTHALLDYHNSLSAVNAISLAYQGTEGSYSYQAAHRHFGERYDDIITYGYDTYEEAAKVVEEGEVDAAILPIESTSAGSINETYDILGDGSLVIIGEEVLRVRYGLLGLQKVPLSSIKRILSHPQALAQCNRFLSKLGNCHVESYLDTALAARKVLEDGDLSQAAIAGLHTAEMYGLQILERDIVNHDQNYTRFVIVAKKAVYCDPKLPSKTSLVMATSHQKGALIDLLRILGDYGINMTKLESRPRPNVPWQYLFYLDIEGNTQDPNVEKALSELEKKTGFLKVLGCYPAQSQNEEITAGKSQNAWN